MIKKICILGLGYIGLPTAALLSNRGFYVHGVDIEESKVDTINKGKAYFYEPGLDNLISKSIDKNMLVADKKASKADVFIIAVPTPFKDNFEPNIDFVIEAIESIIPFLEDNNLIIIESTIPVGTTKMVENYIKDKGIDVSKIHIAHCPERVLPGNIIDEMENNDRIVGGTKEFSTEKIADFYKSFVKGNIFSTDDKTAEMAKLTENSFRDLNIAFANEISMICDKENINPWELINLANKHPRVNILNPSPGVGGHCIAVDPWFIINSNKSESQIIKKAREVNLFKTEWVINQIKSFAIDYKKKHKKNPTICCMGLSYKPNVDDCRESPSIQIVNTLEKENFTVVAVEPNIDKFENINLVNLEEGLNNSEIVVWLVKHKEFENKNNEHHLDFCGMLAEE